MRPEDYAILGRIGSGMGKPKYALVDFMHAFDGHPIVGPGREFTPADPRRSACDPFLIFGALCFSPFTTVTLPGRNGSLLTLGLVRGEEVNVELCDTDYLWNWRLPDAREFVIGMHDHDLIDDELQLALLQLMPYGPHDRRPISAAARTKVLAKTSGRCVYCAIELTTLVGHPHSFHADHVLPVALGGTEDIANLVPACAKCNMKKSTKTLAELFGLAGG